MTEHLDELVRRMETAIDVLRRELAGLRTGRASPQLLEPVQVEHYGTRQPISQLGTISVPEARMLSVQVWDKSAVRAVDKAIRDAGLGLNPLMDGQIIRVPIPEMTQERRREMGKLAGKYAEAARVSVRNLRREGMDRLKKQEKEGEISEDAHRRHGQEIQKATDTHIGRIDELLGVKEKEISGGGQ